MNCLLCGRPTRVLSTRDSPAGVVRVRQCTAAPAHGEDVFTTHELPAAVVSQWGPKMTQRHVARAQRGLLLRARSDMRRQAVADGLAAGKTCSAIARDLGVTEARVRQMRGGK